jgi:hypothetical protein
VKAAQKILKKKVNIEKTVDTLHKNVAMQLKSRVNVITLTFKGFLIFQHFLNGNVHVTVNEIIAMNS